MPIPIVLLSTAADIEPDQDTDHELRHHRIFIKFVPVILWPFHCMCIDNKCILQGFHTGYSVNFYAMFWSENLFLYYLSQQNTKLVNFP